MTLTLKNVFLVFLCITELMVLPALGTYIKCVQYIRSNRAPIPDKAACEAAAASLGLDDVTAFEDSDSDYPPGCFWRTGTDSLWYNTRSASTASCTSTHSVFCLCGTAPDCTHTNGATLNTDACFCGNVFCTESTGLICYSTYGGGSCRKTGFGSFGYTKEAGNTTCGSESNRGLILDKAACEAAATSLLGLDDVVSNVLSYNRVSHPPGCFWSGSSLYYNKLSTSTASCTSYSDFCLCIAAPDCTHTNGVTSNTDTYCLCGGTGVRCTAASGLFCTSSVSFCSKTPGTASTVDGITASPCSVSDGSLPNKGDLSPCICRNDQSAMACTEETGTYCVSMAETKKCSKDSTSAACHVVFKHKTAETNSTCTRDDPCVLADPIVCPQAALAVFVHNSDTSSLGWWDSSWGGRNPPPKTTDTRMAFECNEACQATASILQHTQTLYYINMIDMILEICTFLVFLLSFIVDKNKRLDGIKRILFAAAFADVVLQGLALGYTFATVKDAKPLFDGRCFTTTTRNGLKSHETLTKLLEALGTTAILGWIELACILGEVADVIADLKLDAGDQSSTTVHVILFMIALLCQTVGTALAVVDFVVFTISAQDDADMLFSASMSNNATTGEWNTKDWCVEMTSDSQICLHNHSIVDLKPSQLSSASAGTTLLFLPMLVVIATTAAAVARL